MNGKLKVLHITGHLGGGVGTVVVNYLVYKSKDLTQSHEIVSLDSINKNAAEILDGVNIRQYSNCNSQSSFINERIANADVVLLHWWNHPFITDWMIHNITAPCRMVIWSHISGSPPPNNFTQKTFEYPDEFVFTTPLSYFDPEYFGLPEALKAKVSTIWSTGGVERLVDYSPLAHSGFNIGYVGNLDFTKIHPDFVEICRMVDLPDVRFTVVGPLNDKLVRMIAAAGLADRVRFTGFVSEEQKWAELCRFDLFGYPLAPHHYGTCDQTLQEAMAVGIVPVVLNNPMESLIVKHGQTGLVADSIAEYVEYIHMLYNARDFIMQLSKQARGFALSEYSLSGMSGKWDEIFSRLMQREKQEKSWPGQEPDLNIEPHHVFIESLGRYAGLFVEHLSHTHMSHATAEAQLKSLGSKPNWASDNKSTVHQFAKFFPNDPVLIQWSDLMRGKGGGYPSVDKKRSTNK